MTVGMLRQVILCKQKKGRWPTSDPPLANSLNGSARCSLTLKKYKIVLKIRKDHLRIIFFLRSLYRVVSIYEMYTYLTVMTLLNFNHFLIITQAWIKSKRYICKSFMFVAIFLDIYENPRRKNFTNSSCPKHREIIEINNETIFIFTLLCGSVRIKIHVIFHFSPLFHRTTSVKTAFCRTSILNHFYFFKNIDT